jgi:hypothetical protein
MSKSSIAHQSAAAFSASTESVTAYQAALTRFGAWSSLEQIHTVAKRNGWKADKLAADVWQELYNPEFEPWLAVPELA